MSAARRKRSEFFPGLALGEGAAIAFAAMLLVIVPAVVPVGKYDYGKR